MSRATLMTFVVRICFGILFITVGALVFGPTHGAESQFGLTDKEAHVLAFYALTVLGLLAAPKMRKWDVALIILAIGGIIELIQPLFNHDADIYDWVADGVGVMLAVIPMMFQSLRVWMRKGEKSDTPRRRRSDHRALRVPNNIR